MSNLPTSNVYRIVSVRGQGFGWFTPEDWAETPSWAKDRVHILATVATEQEAKEAFKALPQSWKDIPGLHYQGGEWWESTGVYTNVHGQDTKLFRPVDRSLPVISVATEKLLPPPDRPNLLTD